MHISPFVKDPYLYLKDYCKKNNLPAQSYDFGVLEIETIVETSGGEQKKFTAETLAEFDDDVLFVGLKKISQRFKIEIVPNQPALCEFKLAADKQLLKLAAIFYKNQIDFTYPNESIFEDIKQNLIKKCVKSNLLVDFRKQLNDEQLLSAIEQLREGQEKIQLVISKGVPAFAGALSKTIEHYKNKPLQNRARGFIWPITADELALEFVYSIPSTNGRNLAGRLIRPEPIKFINKPPFAVDSMSFDVVESDTESKFIAKKPGYIVYDRYTATYLIEDELKIKRAGFKETGDINGGDLDANVALFIDEADILEDAVGPNVRLNVARLNVLGSVAQNAIVRAGAVRIGGQTHNKCKIYAKEINIASHRGFASGEMVEIERLEGGVIEAKTAKINKALGGKIYANEIEITEALGNTYCQAGKSVKIINCEGKNTKIVISPVKDFTVKKRLEELTQENKNNQLATKEVLKQLQTKKRLIENNRESIAAIGQKIKEIQASNQPIPTAFSRKMQEFSQLVAEYNELNTKYKDLQLAEEDINKTLMDLQDGIFSATVECVSAWSEGCVVQFELISPEKTFTWVSKAGDKFTRIRLERGLDPDDIYIKKETNDSNA